MFEAGTFCQPSCPARFEHLRPGPCTCPGPGLCAEFRMTCLIHVNIEYKTSPVLRLITRSVSIYGLWFCGTDHDLSVGGANYYCPLQVQNYLGNILISIPQIGQQKHDYGPTTDHGIHSYAARIFSVSLRGSIYIVI